VGLSQQYEALSLPVIMQPKDGTWREEKEFNSLRDCLVRLRCICSKNKSTISTTLLMFWQLSNQGIIEKLTYS
jgi:hypothetical protein